ncbi:MAG: zinc ribbon domain-containing protein [Lachnospiraceae bacterium]|nr:zinc ribbon domain-containing protein [Lachnospiraceae bacterium]
MDFFGTIGDVISGKGKEAADAAKKLAEVTSLKTQIGTQEAEIKKKYRMLGEAYYEAYKDSEITCEFEEQVQEIREVRAAIQELEKKVYDLKGCKECPSCKAVVADDSCFCSKCGASLKEEGDREEEAEEASYTEVEEDCCE